MKKSEIMSDPKNLQRHSIDTSMTPSISKENATVRESQMTEHMDA